MRDHGAPARGARHHRPALLNAGKPAGPGMRPILVNRTDDTPPGCVAIPLLVVVVPVRLVWEAFSAAGRLVRAYVVRPIGWLLHHVLVRPLRWLLLVLVLRPLWWMLLTFVLLPARWMFERILVPAARMIAEYVLRPLLAGLAWLVSAIAVPVAWLARQVGRALTAVRRVVVGMVLWPILRAVGRLLAHAWRLAGVVLFHLLVRPARFLWRVLVRPPLRAVAWTWRVTVVRAARWTRVHLWEPARASARSISRALGLAARRP